MIAPAARRSLAALAGCLAGTLVAGAASGALHSAADRVGGAVREAALHLPVALALAAMLVPAAFVPWQRLGPIVKARIAAHGPTASAAALVLPPAFVVAIALTARLGRFFLTAFHNVGLASLAQAVVLVTLGVAGAVGVSGLVAIVSRRVRGGWLRWGFVGVVVAFVLVLFGTMRGDVQGVGGMLGAFGVLKKPELDLSPVVSLGGAALASVALAVALSRRPAISAAVLVASMLAATGALVTTARAFDASPAAVVIEARPGLARTVLRIARRRTDRDHDGASALFGGHDCDDHDPRRNPDAIDTPGNGIDEDCSGSDAPVRSTAVTAAPPPSPTLAARLAHDVPRDTDLLLITVDTLRADLHYAGNPRPLSPVLDALAARSIVFDHAYAISSYTGKAVAPLLAGRYPTECPRDAEHFTRYFAGNVLLGERLHDAAFRTLGAASHFYFERRFGLAQGMDAWDLAAEPGNGEQETTSNDARVADRLIALWSGAQSQPGRLFAWGHFFDPHKQYVSHPDGASFGDGERARYDAEVAWTDRQIGRVISAVNASPRGARTIVVVTADHGEAFGEHGMSYHGVELWEELVRVPLIVFVPGLAPRRIEVPRSQIDLVPTLLALLDVPAPASTASDALSGVSLVPDLLGEPLPARPVYLELPEGPYNSLRRAVVYENWKLVERGARRFELYDLARDPLEHANAAAREPARLATMRAVMDGVRASLHTVAPGTP